MKLVWNEIEQDVPQPIVETLEGIKIECRKPDGTLVKILKTAHNFPNNCSGEGTLTIFLDVP